MRALFDGISPRWRTSTQVDDAPHRAKLFARFQPGGWPYEDTVGIYRRNVSAARIGIFDRKLVTGLPPSVQWIAHNGAGYDRIEGLECAAQG